METNTNNLMFYRRKRRPGLRDLAEKLGVSHTAVARALRDDPRLTDSLRQRVRTVAREEGYLFSDVTKSLITGWSGTIGVVVPALTSSFVIKLINGIAHQLWEDGTVPMVLCSDYDATQEEQMLQALAQKRASGVIIMPSREDRGQEHFAQLLQSHTPIVSLDTGLPRLDAPLVSTDDEHGAALATWHLVEQGHRHIMHLSKAIDNEMADLRRETGYQRVMEQAGLEPQIIHLSGRRFDQEAVIAQLNAFFRDRSGPKTTAVFAVNDSAAYCVYAYAQRHGLRIGQDLALIGYGNGGELQTSEPQARDFVQPTLSSIEQHPGEMGRAAVKILRQLVAGHPVRSSRLIEPELIVCESSGDTASSTHHTTPDGRTAL